MTERLDRAVFRLQRERVIRKHELSYLFWECTTRCNLHCGHCGSDCSAGGLYPDMPAADFLAALDTLKNPVSYFTVVMTGGEPLLRDDIEYCGREIRKRGLRWSLVSNGYLYTAERHNSLLNAGLGALTISLDGLEDSHNWLRNKRSGYLDLLNAIELAASAERLNFDVVTCVNSRNIAELPQIESLLSALGVKAWRLFTILPVGRAAGKNELLLDNNDLTRLMDFIAHNRKESRMDIKFSCEGYVGNYEKQVRESRFFCRAGINIASILADGSVSACPNNDRQFVQGNIYSSSLKEIWQQRFQPFRDRRWNRSGICGDCREYNDCLGSGFHNWRQDSDDPLVCHYRKLQGQEE